MSTSAPLTGDQLRRLVHQYYDIANVQDPWPAKLRAHVLSVQERILNDDTLARLSDEELVAEMVAIYRGIVNVPLYYKALVSRPRQTRAALEYILHSGDALPTIVDNVLDSTGQYYFKGLGKSFWSLIFMALDPTRNPYWNQRTESALQLLGLAAWARADPPGRVYEHITAAQSCLAGLDARANLYGIDHLMYYVTAGEGRGLVDEWRQSGPPVGGFDDWGEAIARWRADHLPPERIAARLEAEGEARELLQANLGHFDEDTLRRFLELVNIDYQQGQVRHTRFAPAFVGATANRLVEQLDLVNEWLLRLWTCEDDAAPGLLATFCSQHAIVSAGTSLPTLVLYLRDPERYAIWLNPTVKGLQLITEQSFGRLTANSYATFCRAVAHLRKAYDIAPQEIDEILVAISHQDGKMKQLGRTEERKSNQIDQDDTNEHISLDQLQANTLYDTEFLQRVETLLLDKGQIVFYGPPGTGKTFLARQFARYFVNQTGGDVQMVQFHPSYGYEEFIEGIRPRIENGQLTYAVEAGLFRNLCDLARRQPEQRHLLIVDEINRGNLPRIFGELLYLLEYRDTDEPIVLPYSRICFTIPRNVYVIGTMNTADRSTALVDHALRRRFHFIAIRPEPDILQAWLEQHGLERFTWLADLLRELNRRLDQDQIDWHLHIGHSHWMVRDGVLDDDRLDLIWQHTILPTLDEYFYSRPDRLLNYDYDRLRSAIMPQE